MQSKFSGNNSLEDIPAPFRRYKIENENTAGQENKQKSEQEQERKTEAQSQDASRGKLTEDLMFLFLLMMIILYE